MRKIQMNFVRSMQIVFFASIYVAAARLGLMIYAVGGFAALVWPPTGISLGFLFRFGYWLWPGIALGAFVTNWSAGASPLVALGIAIGNSLEGVLAVYLLRRFACNTALQRIQDVIKLLLLGGIISPLVSSLIGTSCLTLGHIIQSDIYWQAWSAWWFGDLLANLIVAPLLFVFMNTRFTLQSSFRRLPEGFALLFVSIFISDTIFRANPILGTLPFQQPYFVFPALLWASIRFEQRGAAGITYLITSIAIWGTMSGTGPFSSGVRFDDLLHLQIFTATAALMSLILAAAISEQKTILKGQRVAIDQATKSEAHTSAILQAALDCIVSIDHLGQIIEFNPAAEKTFQLRRENVLGKEMASVLIPPSLRDAHRQGLAHYLATGDGPVLNKRIEVTALRADGTEFPVELSILRLQLEGPPAFTAYLRDITELKRIEEERARYSAEQDKSQRHLRQLIEQSPYAVAMLDREMKYIFVSQKWLSDFRLNVEEVQGQSHYEIFPETPPYWKEIHQKCLGGAIEKSEAEPYSHVDGTTAWIRWEIRPWYDNTGAVGGILIFTEDITTRMRSQEELLKWAHVFQNAAWGISLASPDNRFLSVNNAFAKMHGTTPEEWIGQPLLGMFADVSKQKLDELTNLVHEKGYLIYESIHQRKDGTQFPVLTEVSAFKDQEGRVLFRAANYQDISEKRSSEKTLQEERERLKLALIHAGLGTWDWDLINNRIIWDETAQKLLGFMPGDFPGTREAFEQSLVPEDRERIRENVKLAFKTRSVFDIEYRVIWPNKSIHWLQSVGRAQYDSKGTPYRVIGTILETTQRRQDEEDLRTALRTRDEFLSIASHELKTPLTSLKLHTQLFRRNIEKNDPRIYSKEHIEKLVTQTETQISRLTRLVDDMLDISRIRTGKLSIQSSLVNLNELVHDVIERLKPQFLITCGAVPKLSSREELTGNWDRLRLEQVVTNLLTNALRYGKERPIHLWIERIENSARLSVQDQGIGIAAEDKERIFNRFERAVSATEVSGFGLGLFITKQIIDAHQGKIWVESDLGKGSTFVVELPGVIEISRKFVS